MKNLKVCLALCALACTLLFIPAVYSQESTPDWKSAVEKGNACIEKDNIRLATFYYANAMGKSPGNIDVISTYRKALLTAVEKTSDSEKKYGYLTALEMFLQNQVSNVPTEKVELIATWLDEIATQKNKLEESNNTEEQPEVVSPKDEITQVFEELKQVLTEQSVNVRNSIKLGEKNENLLDVASYQLQECEQIIRSMIAIEPKLNEKQRIEVGTFYAGLKTLSEEVLNAKSKNIWEKYVTEEYCVLLDQIDIIPLWNTYPSYGDGTGERIIKLVQRQMNTFQKILPLLSNKYIGENKVDNVTTDLKNRNPKNAMTVLHNLQEMLKIASESQQKNYNVWAMSKIQSCLNTASNHEGAVWNGATGSIRIGEALISELAPIDQRFLTQDVQRCYQEVLNKFLTDKQLYNVKNKESWSEPGNMGYTMIKMYETPKVKLSQF